MKTRLTLLAATLALSPATLSAQAQSVGVTAAVNQSAQGAPPNRAIRTIALGDNVIHDERITTDGAGLLQILLADGTTFTVGPNSSLSIDRFVYDPNRGTAQVAATLTRGVFRFIGGRTSKTPGGVSLESPVGTIGIRGAVADISLGETDRRLAGDGNVLANIDLVFGKEITLRGRDGRVQRIYAPGYSIVVGRDGAGQKSSVRKTPAGNANAIQLALSGAPGTGGGSPNRPNERIVVASRVDDVNSARRPVVAVPVPSPRPAPPPAVEEVVEDGGFDLVRETALVQAEEQARPDPDPGPDPVEVPTRVLTAGSTYTDTDGTVIRNPGAVGLTGGSAREDQSVALTLSDDGTRLVGRVSQLDVSLPVYSSTAFTAHSVELGDDAGIGNIALTGTAYSNAGGFTAYMLALDGDPTRPFHAFTGTPIADLSRLRDGDVRTYALTADPLQNIAVPFTWAEAGIPYENASITDFHVVEGAGGGGPLSHYQSSLLIEGEGVNQVSFVGANIGNPFTAAEGGLALGYSRRGSMRYGAYDTSFQSSGGISSVGVSAGDNDLFGPNGESLVLTNDSDAHDFFANSSADYARLNPNFGTTHVLSLQDERSAAAFSAARGATRGLGTPGATALGGYASGLQEISDAAGNFSQTQSTSGANPSGLAMAFDTATGRIGGELEISGSGRSTHIAFGSGVNGNTGGGRSSLVDDDMFGATQNNNRQRSYVELPAAGGGTRRYVAVTTPATRTYLVSGDANPMPNLLPGGRMCDCRFLEWGWWGTQVRGTTNTSDPTRAEVRSGVHLGNWVAGDIASDAEIGGLTGSASYSGHALGSVSQRDATGVANYIARGSMQVDYDFGRRSGAIGIGDFDGRDFSGTIGSGSNAALFSGGLQQDNDDATGTVQGAFVNNGSDIGAGMIGNFRLGSQAGDWTASGIIAGGRNGP